MSDVCMYICMDIVECSSCSFALKTSKNIHVVRNVKIVHLLFDVANSLHLSCCFGGDFPVIHLHFTFISAERGCRCWREQKKYSGVSVCDVSSVCDVH